MRIYKLLLVFFIVMLAGCLSNPEKKDAAAKPDKKEEAKKSEKSEGGIVGTPAAGSKFAKLKLGMPMNEVFAKIGKPDNEWKRPTGKSAIPFYFGDDRWVREATYKKEGKLTFNNGGDQALTDIVVNKAEE